MENKKTFTLEEVKNIALLFVRAATPSEYIFEIEERFNKIWDINFEKFTLLKTEPMTNIPKSDDVAYTMHQLQMLLNALEEIGIGTKWNGEYWDVNGHEQILKKSSPLTKEEKYEYQSECICTTICRKIINAKCKHLGEPKGTEEPEEKALKDGAEAIGKSDGTGVIEILPEVKKLAIAWIENYKPYNSILPEIAQKWKLAEDIQRIIDSHNKALLDRAIEKLNRISFNTEDQAGIKFNAIVLEDAISELTNLLKG